MLLLLLLLLILLFLSTKNRDSLHHIHRHDWYAKSVIHAYKMNNFFVWMTLFEIACEQNAKQIKQLSKKTQQTQKSHTTVKFQIPIFSFCSCDFEYCWLLFSRRNYDSISFIFNLFNGSSSVFKTIFGEAEAETERMMRKKCIFFTWFWEKMMTHARLFTHGLAKSRAAESQRWKLEWSVRCVACGKW